jgi:membrane fusion protein (multidrug efflux system)
MQLEAKTMKHQRIPLRLVATGLAIAALAALPACGRGRRQASRADAGPTVLGPEDIVAVERQLIQSGPRISGTLDAARRAVVRAELSGRVLRAEVERGERVKEGQLLARIEAQAAGDAVRSARSALQSASSQAEVAERQRERIARLVKAGALADRDLEVAENAASTARAQVADAEARVATAEEQQGRATVRAPLGGVVSAREVRTGDVVNVGAVLFEIVDPSSLRLDATVPATALPALRLGSPAEFTVRGFPRQSFRGTLERLSPAVDPATRQLPILISLPNPGERLVAGLFADGRVVTAQHEGLVAPRGAVDTGGQAPMVLRVKNGVVEQVRVRIGIEDDLHELVELVEGVALHDILLIGTGREVAPGTAVTLPANQSGARAEM